MAEPDWDGRPLDPQWLVDSGLLFELNRQMLNPVGVSLGVSRGEGGRLVLTLIDNRPSPESAVYPAVALEAGRRKYVRFSDTYARKQMARRRRAMGQAVQHVEPSWQ